MRIVSTYNGYYPVQPSFQSGKIANSLYGSCLDGTDVCVRLDNYNWKIEKIVILETEEEIEKYKSMIGSMI